MEEISTEKTQENKTFWVLFSLSTALNIWANKKHRSHFIDWIKITKELNPTISFRVYPSVNDRLYFINESDDFSQLEEAWSKALEKIEPDFLNWVRITRIQKANNHARETLDLLEKNKDMGVVFSESTSDPSRFPHNNCFLNFEKHIESVANITTFFDNCRHQQKKIIVNIMANLIGEMSHPLKKQAFIELLKSDTYQIHITNDETDEYQKLHYDLEQLLELKCAKDAELIKKAIFNEGKKILASEYRSIVQAAKNPENQQVLGLVIRKRRTGVELDYPNHFTEEEFLKDQHYKPIEQHLAEGNPSAIVDFFDRLLALAKAAIERKKITAQSPERPIIYLYPHLIDFEKLNKTLFLELISAENPYQLKLYHDYSEQYNPLINKLIEYKNTLPIGTSQIDIGDFIKPRGEKAASLLRGSIIKGEREGLMLTQKTSTRATKPTAFTVIEKYSLQQRCLTNLLTNKKATLEQCLDYFDSLFTKFKKAPPPKTGLKEDKPVILIGNSVLKNIDDPEKIKLLTSIFSRLPYNFYLYEDKAETYSTVKKHFDKDSPFLNQEQAKQALEDLASGKKKGLQLISFALPSKTLPPYCLAESRLTKEIADSYKPISSILVTETPEKQKELLSNLFSSLIEHVEEKQRALSKEPKAMETTTTTSLATPSASDLGKRKETESTNPGKQEIPVSETKRTKAIDPKHFTKEKRQEQKYQFKG
jgi:hypothetical protein